MSTKAEETRRAPIGSVGEVELDLGRARVKFTIPSSSPGGVPELVIVERQGKSGAQALHQLGQYLEKYWPEIDTLRLSDGSTMDLRWKRKDQ